MIVLRFILSFLVAVLIVLQISPWIAIELHMLTAESRTMLISMSWLWGGWVISMIWKWQRRQ